jgi:hypothetical protein
MLKFRQLVLLGFVAWSSIVVGQPAAPQSPAFCKDAKLREVKAICPKLGVFLEAHKDLRQYAEAKKYQEIFVTPASKMNDDPNYKNDPVLREKYDAYLDAAQFIMATNDRANRYVLEALWPRAAAEVLSRNLPQTLTDLTARAFPSRVDQQPGTVASKSGTTTLVLSPGIADLISIAEEAGALTRSVNGATTTYTVNADMLFQFVSGSSNFGCIVCPYEVQPAGNLSATEKFEKNVLRPTEVKATYTLHSSTSATASTSGQASGSSPVSVMKAPIPSGASTFTGVTVKYQVLNPFRFRDPGVMQRWKEQVINLAGPGADVSKAVSEFLTDIGSDPAFAAEKKVEFDPAGFDNVLASFTNAASKSEDALVDQFEQYWVKAFPPTSKFSDKLADAVLLFFQRSAVYRLAYDAAVGKVAGPLFSFQYSFNKPLSQPVTHDFTLIFSHAYGTSKMLNFNGAFSLYNGALPTGAKYGRLHYGQVSGEFDRMLGPLKGGIQSQMSLAGYWQYQPEPSILNIPAGTVVPGTTIPLTNGVQEFVGTAGSLWVTQGKITFKDASGVSVPIGVSWSNKTDLLQGSKVGAQIGLIYNFEGLSSLFTGSSANGK